ncbi:hypothetical protein AOLI_G00243240 [Acnodon oligacanthus]
MAGVTRAEAELERPRRDRRGRHIRQRRSGGAWNPLGSGSPARLGGPEVVSTHARTPSLEAPRGGPACRWSGSISD